MVVKTMLTQYGCEIDIAENGKKALEKLKIKQYDILLLDIIMPEMNGLETIENIRRKLNNYNKDIPVIIVTGDIYINFKEYEQFGVKDIILKPFTSKQILSAIITALSSEIIAKQNISYKTTTQENNKFNINAINQLANGNKNLKEKLITVFIDKYQKDIKQLYIAVEKQNYENIYKTAHSLKPSFSYMKITEAEQKLFEILNLSKNKTGINKIKNLISEITTELKPIIELLENEIKQNETT